MILMDRIRVPDVPLDVYLFLNFRFHIVIKVQSFERVKLLFNALIKTLSMVDCRVPISRDRACGPALVYSHSVHLNVVIASLKKKKNLNLFSITKKIFFSFLQKCIIQTVCTYIM